MLFAPTCPANHPAAGLHISCIQLPNHCCCQVFAGPEGIALRDGSSLTPDAIIVSANNLACGSVLNVVEAAVPMPFSL